MKWFVSSLFGLFCMPLLACEGGLLDQDFRRLASDDEINLCEAYAGQVVLVVNTASKCGNTYQYEGLEKLYEEYGERGLVVLGFPSNDFMGQEPGTEKQIEEFCRLTYGVEFPMFAKTPVKKGGAHPFFNALAMAADRFPVGVGLGQFAVVYPLYHRAAEIDWTFGEEFQLERAHNDHLQILAELGVVGFGVWIAMILLTAQMLSMEATKETQASPEVVQVSTVT